MPITTDDGSIVRSIVHAGLQGTIAYTRSQTDGRQYAVIVTPTAPNPQWLQMPTYEAAVEYIKTTLEAMYQQTRMVSAQIPNGQAPAFTQDEQKRREETERLRRKAAVKAEKRRQAMERAKRSVELRREEKRRQKRTNRVLDKALSFDCPACYAKAWKACQSPNGNSLPRPHAARMDMAEAMIS